METPVEQFQTLVERIPGIVAYIDLVHPDDPSHSTPLYISPQIEALLGYPREAWLNDDELWLEVLHPDDAERHGRAEDERARQRAVAAVRGVPDDCPGRPRRLGEREGASWSTRRPASSTGRA